MIGGVVGGAVMLLLVLGIIIWNVASDSPSDDSVVAGREAAPQEGAAAESSVKRSGADIRKTEPPDPSPSRVPRTGDPEPAKPTVSPPPATPQPKPPPPEAEPVEETPWLARPDPPAEEIRLSPGFELQASRACFPHATAWYPVTRSRVVGFGCNREEGQTNAVWDFHDNRQIGVLPGKIEARQTNILSPDGEYFVALDREEDYEIHVWSVADGQQVGSFPIGDMPPKVSVFVAPRKFLTVAFDRRPSDGAGNPYLLKVYSIPEGNELLSVPINLRGEDHSTAISDGGRYYATCRDKLHVFDLTTGETAGIRNYPHDEGRRWICNGASFSPDGSELAAIFDTNPHGRLLCWSMTDGRLTADIEIDETGRYQLVRGRSECRIDWFENSEGWLILSSHKPFSVDRKTGQTVWVAKGDVDWQSRLVDGHLLVAENGFEAVLYTVPVSLTQPPDLSNPPDTGSSSGGGSGRGVVRIQVLAYHGREPARIAVLRAVRGIPWADASLITIDEQKSEVIVGVRSSQVNTAPLKEALERVGFQCGRTTLSMGG